MSTKGFLELRNRYLLEGDLKILDSVHIGGGKGSPQTNAAFIRDLHGGFLPGSSLRGVMRTALERILRSLGGDRGCVLFEEGSHPTCLTAAPKGVQDAARLLKDADLRKRLWQGGEQCDICRLFGSPWSASKLRVDDGRISGDHQYEIRDGVGIDRDTESAKEQIKYDFETLESKGAKFTFKIEIENADSTDFALLRILLEELKAGRLTVGGKKSRGLGRVALASGYKVQYFDGARNYALRQFLTSGELKKQNAGDFEREVLKPALDKYLAGGNR